MRILIISQYFKPDITAAAFRISDLVDYLKDHGHNVLLITGYPHKSVVQNYNYSTERDIVRIKIPDVKKKGFISYFKHYFSFMLQSTWQAYKNKKWQYDIIFVSSPPLFVGYGGIWLQRLINKPLVVEIRDIWPDSAVAAGQLKENTIIYRFARYIEKLIYKKARAIAAVSQPMANYVSDYRKDEITVCYNGVNLEKILDRKNHNEHRNKEDKNFTIAYTGNIGLCQAVEILIDAGILIKRENIENIRIRIIGGGMQNSNLQNKALKYHLENVIKFEGPYPKDYLDKIIDEEVDILFLNLEDHPALHKTIPSKLFDYLLFEKPVIYGIYGEGKDILDSLGIGENFLPNSPESLLKAIQGTIKDYDKYQSRAKKLNLILLEQRFSREINFRKLVEVMSGIVS
jgi:glycosyltransferase involved in cell wall biosynthesis